MSLSFSPRGTVLQYETQTSIGFLNIAELRNIQFSGAKYDLADVTHYQSGNFREWLTTLADSGELSVEGNYLPGDAGQQALLGFFNNGTLVQWKITLPGSPAPGGPITFSAYVQTLEHMLPIDKQATIAIKLKITGSVTGF